MKYHHLLPALFLLGAAACQDPSFSIKGNIEGADGKTLLLEKADNAGLWVALDSARLDGKGKFSFSGHAPAAPEIYRLALDGSYIYFPVDSIDHLTLTAPAARFATDFMLEGSENAVNMAAFEKQLLKAIPNLNIPDSAKAFKREVFSRYLQNARGSVVSYYILTKTVDGRPLFDTAEDAAYFGAVATSFHEFRPQDPRCQLLERTAKEGLRKRAQASGKHRVMEATEVSYFPISLPNEEGHETALSELVGKGLPVVLTFEDLSDPETAKLNSELKAIVTEGRAKVYCVGLDADQLVWRNAARNLPFTTVYANVSQAREICLKYNVNTVPTLFLINSAGSLSARPADVAALKKLL